MNKYLDFKINSGLYFLPLLFVLNAAQSETPVKHDAKAGTAEKATEEECRLAKINMKKKVPLPGSLSFFITSAASKVYIISNGNQIYDPTTEKIESVPGGIDPVPTPDGAFVTVPDVSVNDPASGQVGSSDSHGKNFQTSGETPHQRRILATPTQVYNDLTPEAAKAQRILDGIAEEKADDDHIHITLDGNSGLAFYSSDDVNEAIQNGKSAKNIKPAFIDEKFHGSYQSLGVLSSNENITTYRAVNDGNWADYERNNKSGKIERVRGESATPCAGERGRAEGSEISHQLPMLSKDGRYLGVYIPERRSSVVYEINRDDPSKCKEVVNIGFPAGKIDFAPDNSKITFHIDNHGIEENQFSNIGASAEDRHGPGVVNKSKDTIVLHLKNQKKQTDYRRQLKSVNYRPNTIVGIQGFSRLSAHPAPGTGTYYPRFVDNNTVVAAHEEYSKFSLEYFDLEKTKVHPWWVPGVKKEPGAAVLANYALGSLWHNVCWAGKGQDIPSLTQQSLLVQNINPEDCVRLIEKKLGAPC